MRQTWRALSFFRADWPRVAAASMLLGSGTVAGLLKPWPLALVVDSVLGHEPFPEVVGRVIGGIPLPTQLAVLVGALVLLHLGHALVTATQNALVIATEWPRFTQLDLARAKRSMRTPIIFDGRNLFDPAEMKRLGDAAQGHVDGQDHPIAPRSRINAKRCLRWK